MSIQKKQKATFFNVAATIQIVSHKVNAKAINIDGKSPLAYPFYKYKDEDRLHHVNKYRKMFWLKVNKNDACVMSELDMMVAKWKLEGSLLLAHDKPELLNHSEVIKEYLVFEIHRLAVIEAKSLEKETS